MKFKTVFILLITILTTTNVLSQSVLKVGVKESKPFVYQYDSGEWTGLCIDIIKDLSEQNKFEYEFVELSGTYDESIDMVERGDIDILALDMTISSERASKVDFTQPFFTTPTGIAIQKKENSIFNAIFNFNFLKAIIISFIILFLIACLMWFFEKKNNPSISEEGHGIFQSLYFLIIVISTVGFGDISPVTKKGRLLASSVIILSIFMISSLTGIISSSIVLDKIDVDVTSVNDLNKMKTGTISGTFSEHFLIDNSIKAIGYDNPEDAFDAINRGELDAFVYDLAMLTYLSKQNKYSDIVVSKNTFKEQRYGFALQKNDTLTNQLNPPLIELMNGDKWRTLIKKYEID